MHSIMRCIGKKEDSRLAQSSFREGFLFFFFFLREERHPLQLALALHMAMVGTISLYSEIKKKNPSVGK